MHAYASHSNTVGYYTRMNANYNSSRLEVMINRVIRAETSLVIAQLPQQTKVGTFHSGHTPLPCPHALYLRCIPINDVTI